MLFCKNKAFSVAEAMIALLIGSIALGMAAPMITKQVKQEHFAFAERQMMEQQIENVVPDGAIMAFNLSSCPSGWYPLTQLNPDATGAFIRNVGDKASAMGKVQLDAAPNITGETTGVEISRSEASKIGAITVSGYKEDYTGGGSGKTGKISFDASFSSDSYGRKDDAGNPVSEVRPKNIAFLYCVKGNSLNN